MAEDIAPGLRKNVEQSYRNSVANDSELARIQKKIDEGIATGKDLDAFAVRSGELLAQALHEHVSGDILPNGRMYYNIANRLLPPVLRQNYEDVADVSDAIQTIMNEQAGIGIKAQRPELNEDRVEGLVNLAAEAEQYEDIRKELEGDVVNFSQSVATDSVKSNAEFQYQSGLSPKVERTAEPSCCPWCQKLENTYDYADIRGTGNEVWQRHRACRCVVEYVAARKRQNAHTKQVSTMDREASAERIQRAQEAEKQDREQEQAEREERIRRAEELDNETLASEEGFIIIDGEMFTPCLIDTTTGQKVDTLVEEVDRKQLKDYNKKTGWYVNWSKIPSEASIFKLTIRGDDEIQGLIAITPKKDHSAVYLNWAVTAPHNNPLMLEDGEMKKYEGVGGHLMAIAAEKSIEYGFEGAAYGFAANKDLMNYYVEKFGAEPLPVEHLYEVFYSEETMKKFLEAYNYEWKSKN